MATKKKDSKPVSRREITMAAEGILADHSGIIELDELDRLVYERFKDRWTPGDHRPVNGIRKKHLKWQNEVDWVKAYWTRDGRSRYIAFGGRRFVFLLNDIGYIHGHGPINSTATTWAIVRRLLAIKD